MPLNLTLRPTRPLKRRLPCSLVSDRSRTQVVVCQSKSKSSRPNAVVSKLAGRAKYKQPCGSTTLPVLLPEEHSLPFSASLEFVSPSSQAPSAETSASLVHNQATVDFKALDPRDLLDIYYVLQGEGYVTAEDGSFCRLHAGDSLLAWHTTTTLSCASTSEADSQNQHMPTSTPLAVLKFQIPACILSNTHPELPLVPPRPLQDVLPHLFTADNQAAQPSGALSPEEADDILSGVQMRTQRAMQSLYSSAAIETNPAEHGNLANGSKTAGHSAVGSFSKLSKQQLNSQLHSVTGYSSTHTANQGRHIEASHAQPQPQHVTAPLTNLDSALSCAGEGASHTNHQLSSMELPVDTHGAGYAGSSKAPFWLSAAAPKLYTGQGGFGQRAVLNQIVEWVSPRQRRAKLEGSRPVTPVDHNIHAPRTSIHTAEAQLPAVPASHTTNFRPTTPSSPYCDQDIRQPHMPHHSDWQPNPAVPSSNTAGSSSTHPTVQSANGNVLMQRALEDFKTFQFPRQTNKLAFVFDPTELGLSLSFGVEVFEPGHHTPLHVHNNAHELFFVLAGEGMAFCNKDKFPVRPGDCVVFPPGSVHGIDNTSSSKLYCLQLMAPNESFVEYVKSGEAVGRLSDEDLCNLAAVHC